MEKLDPLLTFRKKLQSAESEAEQARITRELITKYPDRYKTLHEYVEKGNLDIQERLAFLKNEVSGDFIDIGSYDGFFVLELEKEGSRAVGVDMMSEAINLSETERQRYPKSKAEFVEAFSDNLPFTGNEFDTVLLSHTLEHVLDPAKTIAEAVRIAKPGGRLIAIVPLEMGNEPTHLRIVDPEWLENELKKYGEINFRGTVGDGIAFISTILK